MTPSPGNWTGVIDLSEDGLLRIIESSGSSITLVESAVALANELLMEDWEPDSWAVSISFEFMPDAIMLADLLSSVLVRVRTEPLPVAVEIAENNLQITVAASLEDLPVDKNWNPVQKQPMNSVDNTDDDFDELRQSSGVSTRIALAMRASDRMSTPLTWTFFRHVPPELRPGEILPETWPTGVTAVERVRHEHVINMYLGEFLSCREFIDLHQLSVDVSKSILKLKKILESHADNDQSLRPIVEDYKVLSNIIDEYLSIQADDLEMPKKLEQQQWTIRSRRLPLDGPQI